MSKGSPIVKVALIIAAWVVIISVIVFICIRTPDKAEKEPAEETPTFMHYTLLVTADREDETEVADYIEKHLLASGAKNVKISFYDGFTVDFDSPHGYLFDFHFEELLNIYDFKISPYQSDDDLDYINFSDVESAYIEQSDNGSYSVYVKMNNVGKSKLSEITKKHKGGFLRVWIEYDSIYMQRDVAHLTDGVFCIKDVKNEEEAKNLADFFNKPHFSVERKIF